MHVILELCWCGIKFMIVKPWLWYWIRDIYKDIYNLVLFKYKENSIEYSIKWLKKTFTLFSTFLWKYNIVEIKFLNIRDVNEEKKNKQPPSQNPTYFCYTCHPGIEATTLLVSKGCHGSQRVVARHRRMHHPKTTRKSRGTHFLD